MPLHSRPRPQPAPADALRGPRPGDAVCGYRLVRKLGDGPRAEVFLGFGVSSAATERPSTAALKICRPMSAGTVPVELEALARAEHPHVVRLVDASTNTAGEACLVLERLSRGSVAHLLERRESLRAGEVVTVLAPVATAVETLHASGVVHGAIGASAVLFRESGAPVLARFGHATLIEPGLAPAVLSPLVADDHRALAALAALLLARVGSSEADGLAGWAKAAAVSDAFGQSLCDRLFELADPEPVVFDPAALPLVSAVPARAISAAHLAPRASGRLARLVGRLPAGGLFSGGVSEGDDSGRGQTVGVAPAVGQRLTTVVASLRAVRTPVWVAAASVLIAAVAALVLVPGPADDTPAGAATRPPSAVAANSAPEPNTVATPAADATAANPTAVEDPVAAIPVLLDARAACVRDLSVICLDGVDQSGSAALDDDAGMISGVRSGGEVTVDATIEAPKPVLVERLGDSALVRLGDDGKPASVLVIRTEAGWRIRDYLEGS